MKIVAESNCARKARRLTSPMNISISGKVLALVNWSTGGMLIPADETIFQKDRIEEGELLMPCMDGIYVLPVQIHPLHWQGGYCGCRFVDMPPRERTIIHAYADFIVRGKSATMSELEDSARIIVPDEMSNDAGAETPDIPGWRRLILRTHLKRVAVVVALLLAIGTLASLTIPAIFQKSALISWSKEDFLNRSKDELEAEKAALEELNSNITMVNKLLGDGLKGISNLDNEQIRLLRQGLKKLETERKTLDSSAESLSEKIARVESSRSIFVNPLSEVFEKQFEDPAPYITSILQDMKLSGSIELHGQAEIDKYLFVAKSRVKQAETALESTRVKREALDRILKRVDEAGAEAGFPLNQRELMKRDAELMRLEEDRLVDVLKLLNDNVEAVKEGNFIYESKLLQRFDSEPTHSLGVATDNNMLN